jgi:hypothetical protein
MNFSKSGALAAVDTGGSVVGLAHVEPLTELMLISVSFVSYLDLTTPTSTSEPIA